MTHGQLPEDVKVFQDARGTFRQLRGSLFAKRPGSLPEAVATINRLATELEDSGVFPRETLPRLHAGASFQDAQTALEQIQMLLTHRFPEIKFPE